MMFCRRWGFGFLTALIACSVLLHATRAADRPFLVGADISMLPEIEKAGGVYLADGKPTDAITIFRDHGFNLFRVRLFVNPSHDFNSNWGATQDLDYVRALAKRIKSAGGMILLDIHYSDSWADPGKQNKPAAWKDLSLDALEKQVYDYTASVLRDLQQAGAAPDMVQVGNEITPGLLWPDGKVLDAPTDQEEVQWQRFAQLFNAGAKAVRDCSSAEHSMRVVLHIHGGGQKGLPTWFFGKFNRNPADFDVIGLSFYPGHRESLEDLKQNLHDVIQRYNKDVLIAEVAYPWKPIDESREANRRWPLTKVGQADFAREFVNVVRSAPGGHGIGIIWWYPEAMPVKGLGIWKNGAMGLFDESGNALPAMSALHE